MIEKTYKDRRGLSFVTPMEITEYSDVIYHHDRCLIARSFDGGYVANLVEFKAYPSVAFAKYLSRSDDLEHQSVIIGTLYRRAFNEGNLLFEAFHYYTPDGKLYYVAGDLLQRSKENDENYEASMNGLVHILSEFSFSELLQLYNHYREAIVSDEVFDILCGHILQAADHEMKTGDNPSTMSNYSRNIGSVLQETMKVCHPIINIDRTVKSKEFVKALKKKAFDAIVEFAKGSELGRFWADNAEPTMDEDEFGTPHLLMMSWRLTEDGNKDDAELVLSVNQNSCDIVIEHGRICWRYQDKGAWIKDEIVGFRP